MICKNCGAQLPDNSVFCGNCGTSVAQEQSGGFGGNMPNPPVNQGGFDPNQNSFIPDSNPNPNSMPNGGFNPNPNPNGGFNPNFNPNAPVKSNPLTGNKIVMIALPVVAVVLVAAIVFGVISLVGSKPEKTINSFMDAFMECDGEAMNKEVSTSYKQAVVYMLETYDMVLDGEISKEADGDIGEYVEELCEDSFEDVANEFFDEFEYQLGNNYKAEYEITAEEDATKEQLDKFNDVVERLCKKDFSAKGLMLADIEVSGKSGSNTYDDRFTLFLCKDGSKWAVIDIYEYGYTFDDLYSGLSINDFNDMFN